jgi:hypothetical protein
MKRIYRIPFERVSLPHPGRIGFTCNRPKYLHDMGLHFTVHPKRVADDKHPRERGLAGKVVLLIVDGDEAKLDLLEQNADVKRIRAVTGIMRDG